MAKDYYNHALEYQYANYEEKKTKLERSTNSTDNNNTNSYISPYIIEHCIQWLYFFHSNNMSCLNSKYLYIYDIERLIKAEKGGAIKSIAYNDILSICFSLLTKNECTYKLHFDS